MKFLFSRTSIWRLIFAVVIGQCLTGIHGNSLLEGSKIKLKLYFGDKHLEFMIFNRLLDFPLVSNVAYLNIIFDILKFRYLRGSQAGNICYFRQPGVKDYLEGSEWRVRAGIRTQTLRFPA